MAMIKDNQLIHTRTVSKATEKIIAKPTPGPGVQVSLGHAPHILVKQTYWRGADIKPDRDIKIQLDMQSVQEIEYVKSCCKALKDTSHPCTMRCYSKRRIVSPSGQETFRLEEQTKVFSSNTSDYQTFSSRLTTPTFLWNWPYRGGNQDFIRPLWTVDSS